MSSTQNLGLNLVPQENKETTTFNTQTMLNENWERIDSALGNYIEEVDTSTYDSELEIYRVVNYRRPSDNSLYLKMALSNKSNGNYLTDTWTEYSNDGVTVKRTITWTLTYDSRGKIIKKVPS